MRVIGKILTSLKAVVFDVDGTLVDLKINWNLLKNHLENTFQKKFQRLHDGIQKLDPGNKKIALEIIANHELENSTNWIINDFFVKWIINHSEKIKICLLSNNTKSTIDLFLRQSDLTKHVSYFISLNDVSHPKPNSEGFKKIINHLNLKSNEILLIGDTEYDEIICKENNISCCISNWLEDENFDDFFQKLNDFK